MERIKRIRMLEGQSEGQMDFGKCQIKKGMNERVES